MANNNILLEGSCYFNREDDSGSPTSLVMFPGIMELSISVKSDIREAISKDKGTYGQIEASVAIPKPPELKLKLRNGTAEGVALALMGSSSNSSTAAGTATAESVTASLGSFVSLAHGKITAGSVVVKDSAGTTTYAEGTDYAINYVQGLFEAKTGGAITAAQALKVDYAYGARTIWTVEGGTKSQAKGYLMLDGRNLVDGSPVKFEAWRALLVSDGDFNLLSDNFLEFGMSGRMELISGKSSPFQITYG